MRTVGIRLAQLFVFAGLLTGCFSHSDNAQLQTFDPAAGHRPDLTAITADEQIVAVSFSGGGTRAAALAYGALRGLHEFSTQSDGSSLIDRIDYLSSVSGGSVTAAWFALQGAGGLRGAAGAAYETDFLRKNHTLPIALRGLNPVALGGYLLTDYKRIDVLADYFAAGPIGKATMAEVTAAHRTGKAPFLMLNAADMTYSYGFSFTQNMFDLLCSDLSSFRVADAVAASAAFPFAFSPITLKNYSGTDCTAHASERWKNDGQPAWIAGALGYETARVNGIPRSPSPNNIPFVREARIRQGYIDHRNKYVHLLDGGLVDNLGLKPLIMMDDVPSEAPGLRHRYRPDAIAAPFDKVKRLLFVVVNARSDTPDDNNQREYPPGLLDTLMAVIGSPLDSSILNIQHQLTAELGALAGHEPYFRAGMATATAPAAQTAGVAPAPVGATTYIATVDFDLIPDQLDPATNDGGECRRRFKLLATSWGLDSDHISALIEISRVLLSRSPGLVQFLKDSGLRPGELSALPFAAACQRVKTQ